MPLFHFHFSDGGTRQDDMDGLELPDAEAAYLEAAAAVRSMSPDLIADGVNPAHCAFEIADADGAILFSLTFAELFRGDRPAKPVADRVTDGLISSLEATHRRATDARAKLTESLSQARAAIVESHALLAQLDVGRRADGGPPRNHTDPV